MELFEGDVTYRELDAYVHGLPGRGDKPRETRIRGWVNPGSFGPQPTPSIKQPWPLTFSGYSVFGLLPRPDNRVVASCSQSGLGLPRPQADDVVDAGLLDQRV